MSLSTLSTRPSLFSTQRMVLTLARVAALALSAWTLPVNDLLVKVVALVVAAEAAVGAAVEVVVAVASGAEVVAVAVVVASEVVVVAEVVAVEALAAAVEANLLRARR